MSYTVKKLADLSGVSVRTLHYYDEIGLLKPAYYGSGGYRYYEEPQLLRLQQILFYRELGFELKEVGQLLSRKNFDQLAALESHKKAMEKEKKRLEQLLRTLDKTMDHIKGEKKMKEAEMYWGFSLEKQKEYEKEIEERYGSDNPAFKECQKRVKGWGKKEWAEIKELGEGIYGGLIEAMEKGLSPECDEVQALIRKHYEMICRFWTPDQERYIGLGELYLEHPDFRKFYESLHPDLVDFLAQGMRSFAKREL